MKNLDKVLQTPSGEYDPTRYANYHGYELLTQDSNASDGHLPVSPLVEEIRQKLADEEYIGERNSFLRLKAEDERTKDLKLVPAAVIKVKDAETGEQVPKWCIAQSFDGGMEAAVLIPADLVEDTCEVESTDATDADLQVR